jgi:tungstate transport system ATP-binding protein
MSHLLLCHSLKRQLGSRVLLSVDQLELEHGKIYLLSGANGAGKTTLLRVLAGLDAARCANFEFEGVQRSFTPYPRKLHRRIGFVHHHPMLFSTSVSANIAYGLRAAGVPLLEARRRADAAITWAGISPLVNTPPQALSAGEKQRVALARVHAMDPVLYLLDEPTANLDENGRDLVTRLIDAISKEGRTLLIACHDRELLNLAGVTRLNMTAGRLEVSS